MTATAVEPRPQLQPLSLGEKLDVSIKICASHWKTLLKTVLVVVVPAEIISAILTADSTTASLDGSDQTSDAQLGGLAVGTLLRIVAVLLVTAACFRVIAQAYLGDTTDWRSSLSFAVRQTGSLLWLGLLYILGVLVATLFFILPGIWLYVAWAFAIPALFVEGRSGPKALGRSFQLVRGRWWRTFWILVIGFVLAAIVSGIVQAVFVLGIVAGSDNDALVLIFSALAGIVGLAISTPFQAALVTVVYFDLRVRKEGYDLELLAQEMRGDAAPAPPAPAAAADDDGLRLPGIP